MTRFVRTLAAVAAATAIASVFAQGAFAQDASTPGAREVRDHAPFVVPVENEPAPRLIVADPLPGPLARGAVLIPYRVENFRILPVLGMSAVDLSPRVGHLHVTVDDLPWRWGDFSGNNTVVVVGLPPGEHKVRIELADPEHRVLAAQTVTFTVPGPVAHPH